MKPLVIAMLFPLSLNAQARSAFTPFVALSEALPTTQWTGGVGITTGAGPLAVRLSAGGGPLSSETGERIPGVALMADSDVALMWGEVAALLGWPSMLAPAPFAGAGVQAVQLPGEQLQPITNWSAGAILAVPIASFLALEGEARWRRALEEGALLSSGRREAWEYRLGMSLRFGGSRGGGRSLTSGRPMGRIGSFPPVSIPPSSKTAAMLSTADSYVGTRYRYGGASPSGGFDCSGFVQYVFGRHGMSLPRTAKQQAGQGSAVSTAIPALFRPGDLLFFASNGRDIDHVAIFAGNGRIVHASSSGKSVRYDDLSASRGEWFMDRLVSVRRIGG